MASSFTPRQAFQIGYGFWRMSCGPSPSFLSFFNTSTRSVSPRMDGVPLKDNAVQSGCFALCAFALALGGVSVWGWGQSAAVQLQ